MKDVQRYELFGGIALKNHAFFSLFQEIHADSYFRNSVETLTPRFPLYTSAHSTGNHVLQNSLQLVIYVVHLIHNILTISHVELITL